MDDNGRETLRRILHTNDNMDNNNPLTQKTDHLQANCVPNGHYKRVRLSLGLASQPSARAVLEPLPPAKLNRSRRLSSEAAIQLAESCSKADLDAAALSNSDELITKMFSNSCMEALNFLKKAFDEKLVSA